MTTAMDWQDSLDDIDQEPWPGSVDQAVAAYDDDNDDDLTATETRTIAETSMIARTRTDETVGQVKVEFYPVGY